jgi:hypothetical protein
LESVLFMGVVLLTKPRLFADQSVSPVLHYGRPMRDLFHQVLPL